VSARRETTVSKMIVDEYGGKDGGHGRAIAKSKNPFWMAEVNLRFPEMPFAGERGRSVVSWAACLRANIIACESLAISLTCSPSRERLLWSNLPTKRVYVSVIPTADWRERYRIAKSDKKNHGVRQQSYLRVIVTASKVYSIQDIIAPA
jgi:hypothetical protein